jgi:Resolvase, N terminal domain
VQGDRLYLDSFATPMAGQRIGYIRVSTLDQQTERQLDGIVLDQTFTDKASGKDTKRPQLELMLRFARRGAAPPGIPSRPPPSPMLSRVCASMSGSSVLPRRRMPPTSRNLFRPTCNN